MVLDSRDAPTLVEVTRWKERFTLIFLNSFPYRIKTHSSTIISTKIRELWVFVIKDWKFCSLDADLE